MTMERFIKRTARLLDGQLASQGNAGLRVGNIKAVEGRIAIADIVGIDGLVAQRFRVDRYAGTIDRVL